MRGSFLTAALATLSLAVALSTAACGGIIDPSKNTVTPFSGTLEVGAGSGRTHEFSTGKNGEFSLRITALSPDSALVVGTSFGQLINDVCNIFPLYVNNFSTLNRTALSGPISKGAYCIYIFDIGTLTRPQTYTIEVSYP